jgi:hypothetical protein
MKNPDLSALQGGMTFEEAFSGSGDTFAGGDDGYPEGLDVEDGHADAGGEPTEAHPDHEEEPSGDEAQEGEETSGEDKEGAEASEDGAEDAGEDKETGALDVADLAKALEMDEDAFAANLKVKVKVNGEEQTLPLSDVLSGYQKATGAEQKFEEASRIRKEADGYLASERQKYHQQYQDVLAQADALYKVGQDLLQVDENSQYLQELRKQDPEEYLNTVDDIRQRANWFKQQANTAFQQIRQQMEQQRQQEFEAAGERLKQRIPDWGDEHRTATRAVLEDFGLAPEEISVVTDDRIIAGAYELHKLRKENEELKAQVEKKVAAAPKTKGELSQKLATLKSAPKKSPKNKVASNLKKLKQANRMTTLEEVFQNIF